ncbi:aminotransferase class III-fold pyridoxal phosphate-dependent enzyme [Pectobacterium carotovorum]|nr:aminotransferase class III-fold pyridoxal phosphate-dependent enzyme [Pectobacterium carotovorum]
MVIPPNGYLNAVRALCSEHECLWILDEIQTGLGRTGIMFACQWEEVSPDIMVQSKSLSGGLIPIGATLSSKHVWQRAYGNIDRFALHTSTFGGGNFAAAAAMAAPDVIERENLAENATLLRKQLEATIKALESTLADMFVLRIMTKLSKEHHMLTFVTANNNRVMRIQPPLILSLEEADTFVRALSKVCEELSTFES